MVGDLTSKTVLSEKKSISLIWPLKSYIRSLCKSEKKNLSEYDIYFIYNHIITNWISYKSGTLTFTNSLHLVNE